MRYIEFGKNHKELSTVILGMMRISSLSLMNTGLTLVTDSRILCLLLQQRDT